MFTLNPLPHFLRKLKKITNKDEALKASFKKTMDRLVENPRNPTLKSHKVTTSAGDRAFSSRVTGDLRIIWRYGEKENKEDKKSQHKSSI